MFTKELFSFLFKVITSWQIIVVTLVLIVYLNLVFYVARLYHPGRSDFSFESKPKKTKAPKAAVEIPEGSDDEDLGLEE